MEQMAFNVGTSTNPPKYADFHDFYEKCRVVSDDVGLSKARLKLVAAAKIVLTTALKLMGMSAPERM